MTSERTRSARMPQTSTARTATTSPCPSSPCHLPLRPRVLSPLALANKNSTISYCAPTSPHRPACSVGKLRRSVPSAKSAGLLHPIVCSYDGSSAFFSPPPSCCIPTPPHRSACSVGQFRWSAPRRPSVRSAGMLHRSGSPVFCLLSVDVSLPADILLHR